VARRDEMRRERWREILVEFEVHAAVGTTRSRASSAA